MRDFEKSFNMMATTAFHKLGDISSDEPDICTIYGEDGDDWIGAWVTGFGFVNVKFPKETTRDLSDEEVAMYEGKSYLLSGMPLAPFKVQRRPDR